MAAPRVRIAFAADVASEEPLRAWLDRLAGSVELFKVGLELFTAIGPRSVELVKARGLDCFLDLKLHDIPATMAAATARAAHAGADLLTLHAAAGPEALRACVRAAEGTSSRLLAVTVLTSLQGSDLHAVGVSSPPGEQVLRLADLALEAGVDGLVCSGHELTALRRRFGSTPLLVVPGVRPEAFVARDDQRRVVSPAEAARRGADVLVIGRPIRHATDPRALLARIRAEVAQPPESP